MPETILQNQRAPIAGIFYGYVIVAVSSLILALIFSAHYAFGVFFKPLSAAFGWTRATTAGPYSLVWTIQGLVGVLMGGINDRFGPRVALSVSAVVVGGGFLLMSQIHALWQLYLFYGVFVGAGLGCTFVPLTSTVARWFVKRRSVMTGIVVAGVGVGGLVGPPIATWLIAHYNWRTSYMILGAVVFGGVLIAAQFLRRDPEQVGAKPFGAEEPGFQQTRIAAKGLSLRQAVTTAPFWIATLVFFCYGYTLTGILVHLVPHITDLGFTPTRAAGVLSLVGGSCIVGEVLLGRIADKIGNKQIFILGLVLMVASLVWLSVVASMGSLLLFAVVFGFAYGGLASSHAPLVAWLFGLKNLGLIFGVCFNGFTLGCAVGPLAAGYIYDLKGSYRPAFILCAVLSSVGFLLMLTLKPAFPEAERKDQRGVYDAAR